MQTIIDCTWECYIVVVVAVHNMMDRKWNDFSYKSIEKKALECSDCTSEKTQRELFFRDKKKWHLQMIIDYDEQQRQGKLPIMVKLTESEWDLNGNNSRGGLTN